MLPVNPYRKQNGLTLIEVLIALAIAGIALTAIIKAASQSIRGTTYLQNKSIAMWVGQELLNKAQLNLIKVPAMDSPLQGATSMLGREWYWQLGEEATANKHIKKVSVSVFLVAPDARDEQSPLMMMESYVYTPE